MYVIYVVLYIHIGIEARDCRLAFWDRTCVLRLLNWNLFFGGGGGAPVLSSI